MSKHVIERVVDRLKNDEEVSYGDILKLLNYADEAREKINNFNAWLAERPGNR